MEAAQRGERVGDAIIRFRKAIEGPAIVNDTAAALAWRKFAGAPSECTSSQAAHATDEKTASAAHNTPKANVWMWSSS